MVASGATNTGDGMRISYYAMKNFNDNPTNIDSTLPSNTKVVNYMILLSDGNPTQYSYEKIGGYTYYFEKSGKAPHNTGDENYSFQYAKFIGENYIVGKDLDMNTFVIGFSAVSSEIDKAQSIAGYCNDPSNPKSNGKYY